MSDARAASGNAAGFWGKAVAFSVARVLAGGRGTGHAKLVYRRHAVCMRNFSWTYIGV